MTTLTCVQLSIFTSKMYTHVLFSLRRLCLVIKAMSICPKMYKDVQTLIGNNILMYHVTVYLNWGISDAVGKVK